MHICWLLAFITLSQVSQVGTWKRLEFQLLKLLFQLYHLFLVASLPAPRSTVNMCEPTNQPWFSSDHFSRPLEVGGTRLQNSHGSHRALPNMDTIAHERKWFQASNFWHASSFGYLAYSLGIALWQLSANGCWVRHSNPINFLSHRCGRFLLEWESVENCWALPCHTLISSGVCSRHLQLQNPL